MAEAGRRRADAGIAVARISPTPLKGARLAHPESVVLGPDGVAGNRRFFVVGADGEGLRTSITPWLALLDARYEPASEELELRFPDGTAAAGSAAGRGEAMHAAAGSLEIAARIVPGPWEEPLSRLAGRPVRIARAGGDAQTKNAPATIVSDGSLLRFAREAGVEALDARRFRMLLELRGCAEHEEDGWEGRRLRVGEAVLRLGGPVDRCAVTTRDPETAERDLDALRVLGDFRGRRASDGAVLFGRYADVEAPGTARAGDPVAVV